MNALYILENEVELTKVGYVIFSNEDMQSRGVLALLSNKFKLEYVEIRVVSQEDVNSPSNMNEDGLNKLSESSYFKSVFATINSDSVNKFPRYKMTDASMPPVKQQVEPIASLNSIENMEKAKQSKEQLDERKAEKLRQLALKVEAFKSKNK